MLYRGLLPLVALVVLANCGGEAPPHAGQPTPQAQSMQAMRTDIDVVSAFTRGSATQSQAETAAGDLVAWSGRLGVLFPPSEAPQQYVDLTREMAVGAPAAIRSTSEPLLVAVKTGDRQASSEQLARTKRDGCGFCHLKPTLGYQP